jgi:transposase
MNANTLLAKPDIIRLESFISEPDAITIVVHSKQKQPCCHRCQQLSANFHSHYKRKVSDLPWHGVTVKLQFNTRKFRCRNELCRQKIFCEQLPDVVKTYARKTCRLDNTLTWLAFALRTAGRLRMKTSGDTLLRRVLKPFLAIALRLTGTAL